MRTSPVAIAGSIVAYGIDAPEYANKIFAISGVVPRWSFPTLRGHEKNGLFFRCFIIMLRLSIDSRMTWIRAEKLFAQN
jgi:hypothetical protein